MMEWTDSGITPPPEAEGVEIIGLWGRNIHVVEYEIGFDEKGWYRDPVGYLRTPDFWMPVPPRPRKE